MRSGKYKYTSGVLRKGYYKYCAYGVLCDLYDSVRWCITPGGWVYKAFEKAQAWAGLGQAEIEEVARFNDLLGGYPIEYIEENL